LIDKNITDVDADTTMLVYKAEAHIAMEQGAAAHALLERVIRINPFYPTVYKRLISIEGAGSEALEKYKEALRVLTEPGEAGPAKDRKS